jgi:hypothetical protein
MNGRRAFATAGLCFLILFGIFFGRNLLGGFLLAPYDATFQSLPALYSKRHLWTSLLFSGYPVAADPQTMYWYPPAIFASMHLYLWNPFVLAAYILASSFTYAYVYEITRMKASAAISAVVFGLSGYLISHLPEPHMLHSIAWLPLSLLAVEKIARNSSRRWTSVLAISIGLSALAGHPQTFAYSSLVVLAYMAARLSNAQPGVKVVLGRYFVAIAIAAGLSAVLFLPLAELAALSVRNRISLQYFATLSLPIRHLGLLFFPNLYSIESSLSSLEYNSYVGLTTLLLVLAGLWNGFSRRLQLFWTIVAIVSLVVSLGASTPLGPIIYHAPGLSAFRGLSRSLGEFTFAIAVLAGLSMSRLKGLDHAIRRAAVYRGAGLVIALMTIAFFTVGSAANVSLSSRLFPFCVLLLSITAAVAWAAGPSPRRTAWLLAVLTIDMFAAAIPVIPAADLPAAEQLVPPSGLEPLRDGLRASGQRMLPLKGVGEPPSGAQPNLSRMWELPSAAGYNPLILSRYSKLLGMSFQGAAGTETFSVKDHSLDVLAVRYIVHADDPKLVADDFNSGMRWRKHDLGISLGSSCGQSHPNKVVFELPQATVTEIGLVTALNCAEAAQQGSGALRVTLNGPDGQGQSLDIRTGIDTAEGAWERRDVQQSVQHARAPIFRSYASADSRGRGFSGHQYTSIRALAQPINALELVLEWVGPVGFASVMKVSLRDNATGTVFAVPDARQELFPHDRWRLLERGALTIVENTRALPRAWFVPTVISLSEAEIFRALKESLLPDGTPFDPRTTALVEEQINIRPTKIAYTPVAVRQSADGQMNIETHSASRGFLVVSEADYPGWHATIDGRDTKIYRTNYLLRGLLVEGGDHEIRLFYRPARSYVGLTLSLISAVASILLFFNAFPRPPS